MGYFIPFGDELHELCLQVSRRGEVDDAPALALEDGEPLFDLIQPGAMHWREVHHDPWMGLQPLLDLLSVMRWRIVADQMNRRDRGRELTVQILQKGDKLSLSLAGVTLAVDPSRASVKRREKIQRPGASILVLYPIRQAWLCGFRGMAARPWLQGGLLVDTQDYFVVVQRARIQVDEVGDTGIERRVARSVRG